MKSLSFVDEYKQSMLVIKDSWQTSKLELFRFLQFVYANVTLLSVFVESFQSKS